jgi:signal transduction histidine kinase
MKTQFFANVSHELRTPLTLILGRASRLVVDPATPPGQRDTIVGMERNARLLLKHVNDLLDVAKLEAGKLTLDYAQVDFAKLARQTAANFDSVARERGFRFLIETPETLARSTTTRCSAS